MSRFVFLFAAALLLLGCSTTAPPDPGRTAATSERCVAIERPDLGRFFDGIEGTFVLLDARTGCTIRYNPARAGTRFRPASTFKIPNTLIALETGVASGPEFALVRDTVIAPRQDWWPSAWAGNHTLRTALSSSVVWYYQELSRRIGSRRMQVHLDRFGYGDRDISGGIDRFWLTGGLRISPDEQIEFLRRFHEGDLGVSDRSTRLVKELLVLEETPVWRLSGKTGWSRIEGSNEPDVGWLVGYLERGDQVYYYATNIEIRTSEDARARLAITRAILGELGLLREDSARVHRIVDASVRPLLAEHDVPGMAVGVTLDGERFFFHYGVASRESGAPVTSETLFEVGSVSKTFTATLAAYAQVLGKLSWDDRPGRFIPELRDSPIDRVALLHLGTYTAGGLPLQVPDGVSDEERMLGYLRQWQPAAAPGVQRRYSNPSIGLLGRIAALALESDFTELVENQLMPRLGLEDSYLRVPQHAMARYAWGYSAADEPVRLSPGVFDAEAYGVRTTAADLIRFVEANIDASRLEVPLRHAVEETHIARFEVGEMVQGLGWEQYPWPVPVERLLAGNSRTMATEPQKATRLTPAKMHSGPKLFNKTGSTNGFAAYVAFVPEAKIGIVMLANRNVPIPARIQAAHTILEQLLRP